MGYPIVYTPEPTKPSGGVCPGARRLYDFCLGTFDVADGKDDVHGLGLYNPRDVNGNQWPNWNSTGSQHASGRAGDCGVQVVRPDGHPEGHRLAQWLVAHHADLGVQEVIFAGKRWDNRQQSWKRYTGRSDHFDHVHWALNQAAADKLSDAEILAAWEQHPPQEEDEMKIIVPEGVGVDAKYAGHAHLVGNGRIVQFHHERQLAGLEKVYGKHQKVDDLTWDVILASGDFRS